MRIRTFDCWMHEEDDGESLAIRRPTTLTSSASPVAHGQVADRAPANRLTVAHHALRRGRQVWRHSAVTRSGCGCIGGRISPGCLLPSHGSPTLGAHHLAQAPRAPRSVPRTNTDTESAVGGTTAVVGGLCQSLARAIYSLVLVGDLQSHPERKSCSHTDAVSRGSNSTSTSSSSTPPPPTGRSMCPPTAPQNRSATRVPLPLTWRRKPLRRGVTATCDRTPALCASRPADSVQ
jgi:hypothetical protein